jgi:hypothetical protein
MKTLSKDEVREIILQNFDENASGNVYLADKYYLPFNKFDCLILFLFVTLLLWFKIYVPEIADCDDFSAIAFGKAKKWLKGKAFGMVWHDIENGAYHAQNFFINQNKEIQLYEPQTGKIKTSKFNGNRIMILI